MFRARALACGFGQLAVKCSRRLEDHVAGFDWKLKARPRHLMRGPMLGKEKKDRSV